MKTTGTRLQDWQERGNDWIHQTRYLRQSDAFNKSVKLGKALGFPCSTCVVDEGFGIRFAVTTQYRPGSRNPLEEE